jgi:hypothetical protein
MPDGRFMPTAIVVARFSGGGSWPGTAVRHGRRKQTEETLGLANVSFSSPAPERQMPANGGRSLTI